MAELAQRLNELALANSNGLLKYVFPYFALIEAQSQLLCLFYSDDEYRLLRQNAFEEYSTTVVVPTEAPVVPVTTCVDVHVRLHTHNSLGDMFSPLIL